MEFANPTFSKGLNCSVRFGKKWFDALDVDDRFPITKPNDENVIAEAIVKGKLLIKFGAVQDEFIYCEHDEQCRTKDGLYNVLKKFYGDKLNDDSLVTVIYYEVL